MKDFSSNIFYPFKIIISIFLTGIVFFTLFRLGFFIVNINQLNSITDSKFPIILSSFFMGFRFDTVVSMYILAVPTLILLICYHIKKINSLIIKSVFIFCTIIYPIAFLICAADIPYYIQFGSRFNTMAFAWLDNPNFVFSMIFQEATYWIILIPLIVLIWFWYYLMKRERKYFLSQNTKTIVFKNYKTISLYIFCSIIFLGVMFLGMRGRIEKKSPIRVGTAFISNYNFPNQMGLNPVFTLLRSWLDDLKTDNKLLKLIDNKIAIEELKNSLKINTQLPNQSPIARVMNDSIKAVNKPNLIMVIMESMSAAKMKMYGNNKNLTPNLESLTPNSYFFNEIYTAGIHTFNGIYSTLYSYPALLKKHLMNEFPTPIYTGLPGVLKQNGYKTSFFVTHDDQFDNIGGFLKANHFDKIISQKDYPANEVLSTLGVSDHFMFEYAIKEINKNQIENKPFFAAFMTSSDHGPYIIPKNIAFKATTNDKKTAIVEYADWSIGYLISLCKNQKWFNNTIFVFVADHGYSGNSPYEISLDYHHTPFIIYSPKFIPEGKQFNNIGLQIDVFPTIMGFIGLKYINNTPGIDLLSEKRNFATFSSDDKIGCINGEYFSIIRSDGTELLYDYKNKSTKNIIEEHKLMADSMKKYSYSLLQGSQWLIKNGFTK